MFFFFFFVIRQAKMVFGALWTILIKTWCLWYYIIVFGILYILVECMHHSYSSCQLPLHFSGIRAPFLSPSLPCSDWSSLWFWLWIFSLLGSKAARAVASWERFTSSSWSWFKHAFWPVFWHPWHGFKGLCQFLCVYELIDILDAKKCCSL